MNSFNEWVVLDDRELEAIAGGVSAVNAVARRQDVRRASTALDDPPSIGLPRTELDESSGSANPPNASIGVA